MKALFTESSTVQLLTLCVALFFIGGCCCGSKRCGMNKNSDSSDTKTMKCPMNNGKGCPKKMKTQTMCPVMDGKINKSLYADVKGYRIYVCCPGCIKKIKEDPEKYIKKLHEEGVNIEKAPTMKENK
jgi:hypothetical protein